MSDLTPKQLAELRRLLDRSVARPRYRAARGHKMVVLPRAGDGYVDERDYLTADDPLPIVHTAHRIECPLCGGSGFDPDPAPTTTRKAQS